MSDGTHRSLNILHVLRAPVGGLFRHVCDLAHAQVARGHRVGVIADAMSGGAIANAKLADLSGVLALGLTRIPMSRQIGAADLSAVAHVAERAANTKADVLHGHGAKGGAYARLARNTRAIRVYTPHGGSLHYRWSTPAGFFYLASERAMMRRTDLFLFESAYGRDAFWAKVGEPQTLLRVVHNGVTAREFDPVTPAPQVRDLAFVGELRNLKGVDVLIMAIGLLKREGLSVSATIAGDGPDADAFKALVAAEGLEDRVHFIGAAPARAAFALGRILVVPSRAESLPYVVIEAAAAGLPLIATNVGGIPEILGPDAGDLIPPGDSAALARGIALALQDLGAKREAALRLQARVRALFSAEAMADAVLGAYRDALVRRDG